MNEIGIMQGRLSPRPYPKLQAFPARTWKKEFKFAKEIGYDYIEWIFEIDAYQSNPLWTKAGRNEIRRVVKETGLPVKSICADYFLERPFYRGKGYTFQENLCILEELIRNAAEIGAQKILLPVLEGAELRTEEEKETLVKALKRCVPLLEKYHVYLGLETELKAQKYKALCQYINHPFIGAYYDTGNCAACGYNMAEDMQILGEHLVCIHIKDRKIHGDSVFLGTGDTNLKGGVAVLHAQNYSRDFTLQTYFEDDHLGTARNSLAYMKRLLTGQA